MLVSPNREIYADALTKLYEMFQTEINIRLKSFLAELEILLDDREYIMEEGDEAADAEPSSLRGDYSAPITVTAQQPPHPPKRKPSAKHRGLDYAKTLFFC